MSVLMLNDAKLDVLDRAHDIAREVVCNPHISRAVSSRAALVGQVIHAFLGTAAEEWAESQEPAPSPRQNMVTAQPDRAWILMAGRKRRPGGFHEAARH